MATIDFNKEKKTDDLLRDTRPYAARVYDWVSEGTHGGSLILMVAFVIWHAPFGLAVADILFVVSALYFWWLTRRKRGIVFKLPMGARWKDPNNEGPGRTGKAEGILYVGNMKKTNQEIWFTNSDARTHILYLGTTGAGKTEGLKSMVTNALTWGSGFVYIDGKADTDLWSSLSALVRRFGRDDDLLVLNYMTGNSDLKAPSNTMNPFSSGSSSYLTNMLVSLMPESEGDNAMWKERAVSLIGAIMPALTWKRDNQEIPMSVSTIRDFMTLPAVVKLARDQPIPEEIRKGIKSYLDTLPGYVDAAFDDEGRDKPGGPDGPPIDTTTARQQHGYLAMQFTRALQSLGDSYGYIFDTQAADVDMVDVVLNRRILVVLIPALEKSNDEIANLGKIVAATIKGMMGSTLGATVEGDSASVIENKPTRSATPFMTVFDEVGYYAASGMAVMAAQARSLGFCLVFSGQDLPAMRKRVKEEVNSIVANCNIKLFGKLEDPTETKDFFEKTVGSALVVEASGFKYTGGDTTGFLQDTGQGSIQTRARASYDGLRALKEGEAVVTFGERVVDGSVFYCNPGHAKAMRVTRFLALPPPDKNLVTHASKITRLRDLMVHKSWTAAKADVALETETEVRALADGLKTAARAGAQGVDAGIFAVTSVYALSNPIDSNQGGSSGESGFTPDTGAATPLVASPPGAPSIFGAKPGAAQPDVPPRAPEIPAALLATPEENTRNPLAFFSKAPQQAPVSSPAPVAPPAAPVAPVSAPPSVTPPSVAPATTTPVSAPAQPQKPAIFTKPVAPPAAPVVPPVQAAPESVPAPAPSPEQPSAPPPVSWSDLVSAAAAEESKDPAPPSAPPAEAAKAPESPPPVSTLPPAMDALLRKAGEDLRSKISPDSRDKPDEEK